MQSKELLASNSRPQFQNKSALQVSRDAAYISVLNRVINWNSPSASRAVNGLLKNFVLCTLRLPATPFPLPFTEPPVIPYVS